MSKMEILEDKLKLKKTFVKYDQTDGDDVSKDGVVDERRAPFESNTLLLQILLEIACRNVEVNADKRQILFLRMWNKLTEVKLAGELKFHMDALYNVRNQAVIEFEKELLRMNSTESSSSDSSNIVSSDESDGVISFFECFGNTQKLVKDSLFYFKKYQSEFEEVTRIGKGGFGTVWKARHKIDDIYYAVKKVMFKYKKDSDYLKVIGEVKSFASLNHLNVVGYNQAWLEYVPENNRAVVCFDGSTFEKSSSEETSESTQSLSIESQNNPLKEVVQKIDDNHSTSSEAPLLNVMLYIQMEYCDFDLRFWIDERAKGNPFQLNASDIFNDILCGVAHIHSKNVIHRDLKPQNIFFSAKSNSMKIGDFGLATLEDGMNAKRVVIGGTVPYAAPELKNNCTSDTKVDMYSVGVILIELLTDSKTRMELSLILKQILSGRIPAKVCHEWPQHVPLMKNLISSDPTVRFSAEYILENLSKKSEGEVKQLKEMLKEKDKKIEELEAKLNKLLNHD